MSSKHKELPPGAQRWAGEVDSQMAELKAMREVVRRLAQNAGVDYSNPNRGINSGDAPSVQNPVGQKISSLADVSTYNVTDGHVLTWVAAEQKWVPKAKAGGLTVVPADTTSVPIFRENLITNPSFENGIQDWTVGVGGDPRQGYAHFDGPPLMASVDLAHEIGTGIDGGNAMRVTGTGGIYTGDPQFFADFGVMIPVPLGTDYIQASFKYDANAQWGVGFMWDTPEGQRTADYRSLGQGSQDNWNTVSCNLNYYGVGEPRPPAGATAQWAYVIADCYRSNAATTTTVTALIDHVIALNTTITNAHDLGTYFDGDSVLPLATTEWEGPSGNSASRQLQWSTFRAPGTFAQGSFIEVTGSDWTPNGILNVGIANGAYKAVQADDRGGFTTAFDMGYVNAPISLNLDVYDVASDTSAALSVDVTA